MCAITVGKKGKGREMRGGGGALGMIFAWKAETHELYSRCNAQYARAARYLTLVQAFQKNPKP